MHERSKLETLLNALDASPRALRKDGCGDWTIRGKTGQIFADDDGWLIVIQTDESTRRWTNIKRRLSFCRVTQDGDDEGFLHLDRLPNAAKAERIRDAIHLRRKRHYTPEQLTTKAALATGLSRSTTKSPSNGQIIRPVDEGLSEAA
jgi:hypothetical protein